MEGEEKEHQIRSGSSVRHCAQETTVVFAVLTPSR